MIFNRTEWKTKRDKHLQDGDIKQKSNLRKMKTGFL